jgi:hypothetical protein
MTAREGDMSASIESDVKHGQELVDLGWLVRYAIRCGFKPSGDATMFEALRDAFGSGGWRVVCRSPKERFTPILRNRELSLDALIAYCQRLSRRSFVQAPQAVLLRYFIQQRRLFLNFACRVPEDSDYALMRVADRETNLRMRDISVVSNWTDQARVTIQSQHKWTSLLRRAIAYRDLQRVQLAAVKESPWYFYCRPMDWRGYRVEPIANSAELWLEGAAMCSCVYKLRHECSAAQQNRFFSIKKDGKRLATLELIWSAPREEYKGMDRRLGRWQLQDLRLSFNRLPSQHLLEAMHGFAWMFNFWAKRPGRMPHGHVEEILDRIGLLNGQLGWHKSSSFSLSV